MFRLAMSFFEETSRIMFSSSSGKDATKDKYGHDSNEAAVDSRVKLQEVKMKDEYGRINAVYAGPSRERSHEEKHPEMWFVATAK